MNLTDKLTNVRQRRFVMNQTAVGFGVDGSDDNSVERERPSRRGHDKKDKKRISGHESERTKDSVLLVKNKCILQQGSVTSRCGGSVTAVQRCVYHSLNYYSPAMYCVSMYGKLLSNLISM